MASPELGRSLQEYPRHANWLESEHLSDFKSSTSAEPRMILCLDIREIHTAPCRYTGQTSKLTGVGFYTTSLFSERTTACNASDSDPPG